MGDRAQQGMRIDLCLASVVECRHWLAVVVEWKFDVDDVVVVVAAEERQTHNQRQNFLHPTHATRKSVNLTSSNEYLMRFQACKTIDGNGIPVVGC